MDKCKKHPKYVGKGTPKNCGACWTLYFSVGAMRKPNAPPKKMMGSSGYSRKTKHKKKSTD